MIDKERLRFNQKLVGSPSSAPAGCGPVDVKNRVLTVLLAELLVFLCACRFSIPETVGSISGGTANLPGSGVSSSDTPHTAEDADYAKAVKWAEKEGLMNGAGTAAFFPAAVCTEGQVIKLLYQICGSPQVDISNPFYTLDESDDCYSAALWAYQNGLVSGYFYPAEPCSRREIAAYLWTLAGSPMGSDSGLAYAPYAISGEIFWEDAPSSCPVTITFSAASVTKESLPYIGELSDPLEDVKGRWTKFDPWRVTKITLRPGSTIHFSVDAALINGSHGGSASDETEFAALFGGSTLKLYYAFTDVGMLMAGKAETFDGWSAETWVSPGGFQDADGDDYVIVYGGGSAFSDVPPGIFAQAAAWAVQERIMTDTGKDTFAPYDICSQEEILTTLYRAFGK